MSSERHINKEFFKKVRKSTYTQSGNFHDEMLENAREEYIFDLLSDLNELGVLSIGFGGGEPTIDRSLSKYVYFCTQKKIKTSISTNGVLVDNQLVLGLKNAGLGIAQISLDGPRMVHNAIRGEGTFDRAIRALQLFSEIGIETRVAMTIMSCNLEHVEETADIAFSNGANRFVVFRYMPSGRSRENLSLSKVQLRAVTRTLISMQEMRPKTVVGYEPLCFYPHLIKAQYSPLGPCNAGTDTLNICHNGCVTPCPHIRNYCLGVYPTESLSEIWDRAKQLGKVIMHGAPVECTQCEFKVTCGGGCSWNFRNAKIRIKDNMCWKEIS